MNSRHLEEALEEARAKILEMHKFISKLTAMPYIQATVYEVHRNDVVVINDNKLFQVEKHDCEPGDIVNLNPQTMQIIGVAATKAPGEVAIVRKLHDGDLEIDMNGNPKLVASRVTVKEGDKVLLDTTGRIAIRNLGASDARFYIPEAAPNVAWDDIGGLEDSKRDLRESIELYFKKPELCRKYGKVPPKGILLYGEPGCGKTLLGKAVASSMANLYNKKAQATSFIYVKGPEILDPYVGVSEATVRSLFQRSRLHKREHGFPAVIFIDEADAILARRGRRNSVTIDQTLVPMFLSEMDGLEPAESIVILTTNRADILDPAVIRDGRVDLKIKVSRPDHKAAKDIFRIHLRGKPTRGSADLATAGADALYSPDRVLAEANGKNGERMVATLADLATGAMIENVVKTATTLALRRELTSKKKRSHGIAVNDVVVAVDCVFDENKRIVQEQLQEA